MAQWLAQATHNRLVVGSNPTGPTFRASSESHQGFLVLNGVLQSATLYNFGPGARIGAYDQRLIEAGCRGQWVCTPPTRS